MIKTTQLRDLEQQKRLSYRENAHTLVRIIEDGTNCSYFESQIIAEKAQEVFQIGTQNTDHALQPGQIIWKAVSTSDKPGKPLEACTFQRVHLTLHNFDEDREVQNKFSPSAKRQQQINRMCQEAFEQNCLLTQEDLAYLLNCDVRTIRRDIKQYQQTHKVLIPTRGNKMDIGPGITHKDKAIELFIQGKDAVSIARDINHSLKAVERYIQTFCRVVYCQNQLQNSLKTAMVLGISVTLVTRHLALRDKHKDRPCYKDRIEEIERVGNCFWDAQDSKKKNGQTTRGIR
jgi:hypothetical protein